MSPAACSQSGCSNGIQLVGQSQAALTFYWPVVARQIRVRGSVVVGSADASAADFRSRSAGARAVALASHQSTACVTIACMEAVAKAARRLSADPDLLTPSWQVYRLIAHTVEFWQADPDRVHARVQYRRDDRQWSMQLLWP